MATWIQESPDRDTTGYSTNYNNINDLLSIPDAEFQRIDTNVASRAYVQLDKADVTLDMDHDTFVVMLEAGHDYRLQITPSNPDVLAYNKMAGVYDPGVKQWYNQVDHILNAGDGYVNGSIYSDTFTAAHSHDYVLTLAMNSTSIEGAPNALYDGPLPYDITLLDLTEGTPTAPGNGATSQQLPRDQVEKMALLYQAALDREPDTAGLDYFVGNLREGQSVQDIASSFYRADEFRDQFERFDNEGYIDRLYQNVLERPADQAGFDYWREAIEVNGMSHAEVLVSFAESGENRANAEDWLAGLAFDQTSGDWVL